ncbi:putative 1-phosphatidylinositol 4-kinase [Lupinus albus]|uniref:Putative 1-phosphatidylinositol 4-kinase n=1 Tax=Lupinus albus TaxID=3870 RepID=A0A6A4PBM8_LUPAL|nr:putative 1-phosphatidylinositol 4-kinase [Lupinus albus]
MSVADVALRPICIESVHWQNQQLGLGSYPAESILIYLTVNGAVTPMHVLESDSIASVKMRIQTCKGIVGNKKQKLVFGGRELARNDSLIKDYGVTSGNVLHLVLRLSDLIFIVVRTTCGKEFEFQIDRHRNVGYLKQHIKKKGKGFADSEDQELFRCDEKLDDQKFFNDICKSGDDVIHLVIKDSAKVKATPIHKDEDVELSVVAAAASDSVSVGENQIQIPAGVDFWL